MNLLGLTYDARNIIVADRTICCQLRDFLLVVSVGAETEVLLYRSIITSALSRRNESWSTKPLNQDMFVSTG